MSFFNFEPDPLPPAKIRLTRSIIVCRLHGQPDAADAGEIILVADSELRMLDPDDYVFLGRVPDELAFDI